MSEKTSTPRPCGFEGCEKLLFCKGYCKGHYNQQWLGKPLRPLRKLVMGTDEHRFWAYVNKDGPTMPHMDTPCWVWTGGTAHSYGSFNPVKGSKIAHRFSWELHNGPIPSGLLVCHHCDNPPCVNPTHLYPGTPKQNTADMMRRGRGNWNNAAKGERNAAAQLNESEVLEIRRRAAAGESQRSLAKSYGVGRSNIQHIIHRRSWKHI